MHTSRFDSSSQFDGPGQPPGGGTAPGRIRGGQTQVGCLPRLIRGLAGALAWGMAVLTIAIAVVQFIPTNDWSAHSSQMVAAHAVGAVVSLWLVRRADRSGGLWAFVISALAIAVDFSVLWWMWWS